MTRSRGANGNARNNQKQLIPELFKVNDVLLRSTYSVNLTATLTPRIYKEWKIHPNYGFPDNGAVNSSYGLNTILGSSSNGLYLTLKVKKVRLRCFITNLDALAKVVSYLKIPYASSGVSFTNIAIDNPHATTFFLAPKGSGGDTKEFTVICEPWQIEGLKDFASFASVQNYWGTNTTVGSQYSVLALGVQSIDDSTVLTNGVSLTTLIEALCEATTNNQKLAI